MTEVMSAPAEAAPEAVVIENPISVDNIDHEAEAAEAEAAAAKAAKPEKAESKPLTTRETIEKAAAKIEADEKAKGEPKAEKAETQAERDEKGKFAPKVAAEPADKAAPVTQEAAKAEVAPVAKQPHDEPPARFSADAKTAWAAVPEQARAETHRAIRELESGIEEHRKQWEPIKPYADLAKQHGTDVHSALERYVSMDKLLNEDLGRGLESIVRDKTGGQYGLKDVIAQLTGQKPEQAQSESAATIHRLEQKIGQLEQKIGGVTGHLQQQTMTSIDEQVAAFSKDKPNFEALADQVVKHIQAGKSLEEAYQQAESDAQEMAKRLGFIPAAAAPDPAPSAQTDKGTKSITGAPSAGSAPAAKKPSPSIQDAVRRAMQAAG